MRLRMLTASFVVVLSVACGGGEPAVEDSGGEAVAITTEPIVDPPPALRPHQVTGAGEGSLRVGVLELPR